MQSAVGPQVGAARKTPFLKNRVVLIGIFILVIIIVAIAAVALNGPSTSPRVSPLPQSPDYQLSVSPQSATVSQGSSTRVSIVVTSRNNFNSPVSMSVTNLPAGISALFDPMTVTPPRNGTASSEVTISASFSASIQSYALSVQGSAGTISRSVSSSVSVSKGEAVRIISSTSFVDSIGYYHIVGEAQNMIESNLNFVRITSTLYDSSNTVVGTDFTFTRISLLLPGQKSPFEIISLRTNLVPDHNTVQVTDFRVTTSQPYSDLHILSHSSSVDTLGYTHIVGEIQNTGTQTINYVQTASTLYDSSNTVIGTDFTFTTMNILVPGQKSPFEILSIRANLVPDHYQLQVADSRITSAQPYGGLHILSQSSSVDILGYTHIVGEIQNTGTQTINSVQVVVTGYDTAGTVTATGFTFTNPSTLSPGQTAPFELILLRQNLVLATYVLQVNA